ncbi:MAG: hypothetical protein IK081_05030 [Lachnospiraceae bacterium]|nr:hypothetical protein [Lachnospiraceae bacterium]
MGGGRGGAEEARWAADAARQKRSDGGCGGAEEARWAADAAGQKRLDGRRTHFKGK